MPSHGPAAVELQIAGEAAARRISVVHHLADALRVVHDSGFRFCGEVVCDTSDAHPVVDLFYFVFDQ